MLQLLAPLPAKNTRPLVDRVRDRIAALGCERVWARSADSHILLGRDDEGPFARISPLGGASYGLAFRANDPGPPPGDGPQSGGDGVERWEPLFLVDVLGDVVEHALVAVGALCAA